MSGWFLWLTRLGAKAFITSLSGRREQSYQQLLLSLRGILREKYSQKPQVTCFACPGFRVAKLTLVRSCPALIP
jgi:hypothetical protein